MRQDAIRNNQAANDPVNPEAAGKASSGMRVLVAGAGTGGHLFPGIAVIDRLDALAGGVRAMFVTTGRPIEDTVLGKRHFETTRISAAGMKGASVFGKLRSAVLLVSGIFEARAILKHFAPHAVVGMGGYSSAPVVLAAWMMRIPRVIHEQNRIAGVTNRVLGRFATRVFVSFPDTAIGGAKNKTLYTGYPVRPEIGPKDDSSEDTDNDGAHEKRKPLCVLVLGGSQGAAAINAAVTGALKYLDEIGGFRFVHQSGGADEETVRTAYAGKGADAVVSDFFTDVASLYRKADLAVCRAGAGTLAELAAARLPAILIPYPYAADDHQAANAEAMAVSGGAVMVRESALSAENLAKRLTDYRSRPEELARMRTAIERNAPVFDAADTIARQILLLCGFVPPAVAGEREQVTGKREAAE